MKCSYNGVVIAALPQSELPYACISRYTEDDNTTQYRVCFYDKECSVAPSLGMTELLASAGTSYEGYYIENAESDTWIRKDLWSGGPTTDTETFILPISGSGWSFVWSNIDLYTNEGSFAYNGGPDPVPVSPVQINPALLVQSFFTGQAVRRMRGQAAWEVLWEGDMTFTEVQASGKYSASVWSDAEPPAQMFYSGETMRLTVDGETKEYTAKSDPYDCAYVGNRWLSLDPIEGEGDTGDDFCVTADTYLISYGFKYTCFARNPGTYHIKITRRKESSPAPVYDQEGA